MADETEEEYYARIERESAELDRIYAEEAEDTNKRSTEFKAKWPNHCPKCGGWGGFTSYNYPHAPDDYDPCDGPNESNLKYCHRCGQDGLNEDAEGPCSHCGWNHDDGDPAILPGSR